jgi:hypothetical protein
MNTRPYVGIMPDNTYVTFRYHRDPVKSDNLPYAAVIGPFRTMRAAKFMAQYGRGNPHLLCVSDAERISRYYA